MKLQDLFAQLSFQELRNLSIANDGDGTIADNGKAAIVGYLNDALLKLYTDLVLNQKDVVILMQEHITNYHLIPRFAENYVPTTPAENEAIRYILDLNQEPFIDDVVRILKVFDSSGVQLKLNDSNTPYSVFTPQAKILQVPWPTHNQTLSVLYQAKHPKIQGDLDEEVEIPDILEEALRAYVAYKVFSHMNTAVSTAKAAEHRNNYVSIIKDVVEKDLVSTSISSSDVKFRERGFV